MRIQNPIYTGSGDTIDVERSGTGVKLMVGDELGEGVRWVGLTVADATALIARLMAERDQVVAEVERRNAKAVSILADLGLDAAAVRGAIDEGLIDPGAVIDRRAAADHDDGATQPPQYA